MNGAALGMWDPRSQTTPTTKTCRWGGLRPKAHGFCGSGVAALVQLPLQAVVLHLTARTRRPIPSGWGNHSMLQ
jgi:hypothetical protein